MSSIEEKRVYADRGGKRDVFVATAMGVVVVAVSDDLVGDFGIEHRATAVDVSAAGGRVAVATAEDVVVTDDEGTAFHALGFGPAVAVGLHDGAVLAADDEGRVARCAGRAAAIGEPVGEAGDADRDEVDDGERGAAWTDLGRVERVRAIDGALIAAADGVHRAGGDGLSRAGLDDVRDVAASGPGAPLAATGDGLFSLGNGWLRELDGRFRAVAADAGGPGAPLAVGDGVYAGSDDGWLALDYPTDDPVVDVAIDGGIRYAVTEAGTFLVDAGDGVRSQALGLHDVAGLAVR
jgi:hypothetical protein